MRDWSSVPREADSDADIVVHVGDPTAVLSFATRDLDPTDVVLTPEQLHERNLKYALKERSRARQNLLLTTPTDLAASVLNHAGGTSRLLDRIDRLRRIETVLANPGPDVEPLRSVLGSDFAAHAETVETVREELAVVTGGDPGRLDALRACADASPLGTAARTTIDGVAAVADRLTAGTDEAVSDVARLRAAADALRTDDGDAWRAAFPTVERVHLAGVSTLGAALLDVLGLVADRTEVTVHLFLRSGTGPEIAPRLEDRLDAVSSDARVAVATGVERTVTPRAPATEVVARTPQQEAHATLALVDALLGNGASASEVAIVARDVDAYERLLSRAAEPYGRCLSVWTQLPVAETVPYHLLRSTCRLLAARRRGSVTAADLFAPLEFGWHPPERGDHWPLDPAGLARIRRSLAADRPRSLSSWRERLGALDVDRDHRTVAGVRRLVHWTREAPAVPTGPNVRAVLAPLVDPRTEELPARRRRHDRPDLAETSRAARAVVRASELVSEVAVKLDDWETRGRVDPSWEVVRDLLEAITATRPGRREHDNAEAIDVLDGTDTWLRSYPYVVAVGLTEGTGPSGRAVRCRHRCATRSSVAIPRRRDGWPSAGPGPRPASSTTSPTPFGRRPSTCSSRAQSGPATRSPPSPLDISTPSRRRRSRDGP
ncbi:hypothetical protein VB773_22180 [Haloarculaceae archaeon H-GB2-1]|nr:hypothetical protein [Haloarculaceae archaeon H-GB11]MEA5410009.1 hypothetical protein [Haloarculaceae archaeon H-GB2-1]